MKTFRSTEVAMHKLALLKVVVEFECLAQNILELLGKSVFALSQQKELASALLNKQTRMPFSFLNALSMVSLDLRQFCKITTLVEQRHTHVKANQILYRSLGGFPYANTRAAPKQVLKLKN
mgnify:FL=1